MGEAKMTTPLIFLSYFVKYYSFKGHIMFKLHMGVCEGVLLCSATPTNLPCPPFRKKPKSSCLLISPHILYFYYFDTYDTVYRIPL